MMPVRFSPRIGLVVLGGVFLGCTSLTAEGQRVRVVDDGRVGAERVASHCRYLGAVTARAQSTKPGSPWTGNFAIARSNAQTALRNKAAEAGADTVLNIRTEDDFWGVDAKGDAYYCGSGPRQASE